MSLYSMLTVIDLVFLSICLINMIVKPFTHIVPVRWAICYMIMMTILVYDIAGQYHSLYTPPPSAIWLFKIRPFMTGLFSLFYVKGIQLVKR